jgi:hypothetical protein
VSPPKPHLGENVATLIRLNVRKYKEGREKRRGKEEKEDREGKGREGAGEEKK